MNYDRAQEDMGNIVALEHKVRSLKHPLWGRTFVIRNPSQSQRDDRRDRGVFAG